jgi:hypothetical protein
VTGEDFEANTLLCQIVHRINQVTQVAAESIEFPDHQTRVSPVRRALSVASRPGRASNRPEARSS